MTIQQPQSSDKLNSPNHALSHRVFANDDSAPNQTVVVDENGDVDISNNLDSAKYITGKKSGIYAYLTTPADTTITTAETYYPILGTFINSPIEDFSAAVIYTPGIKYDGVKTQYFEIDWHVSGSANVANTTVKFGVKKNNVFLEGSDMQQFCKNANEIYALSGTTVVELAQNDEIQLVITSDGNGDIITIYNYTTTISEFFD